MIYISNTASITISDTMSIPNYTSDTITITGLGSCANNTTLNSIGTSIPYTTGGGISYNSTTSNWAAPNTVFNGGTGKPVITMPTGENTVQIEKEATLDVKGNLVINGVNLEERLRTIETLLQIPTRDVTMETKHPKLANLYKEYMHELEKYKTWDRLQGEEE